MRRIVLTYLFLSIIGILGAVAQTPFNRMDPTTGRDQFGNQDVVSSVLQRDANAIRMTAEALDRAQMTRAVGAILRARCIYIVGVRSSAALANYLNFYFRNIFENVRRFPSIFKVLREFDFCNSEIFFL